VTAAPQRCYSFDLGSSADEPRNKRPFRAAATGPQIHRPENARSGIPVNNKPTIGEYRSANGVASEEHIGCCAAATALRMTATLGDLLILPCSQLSPSSLRCCGLDFAPVLPVSEDLDELLELSDRLVVMFHGQFVHEARASEANLTEIWRHMAGH
jgi:hypothetical protein